MKEIDRYIMNELINDAQIPFRRIALKLGVSPETVRKRYEKMKTEGRINQCMISVNLEKIGYNGLTFLMIACKDIAGTIEHLKKMRNIICVAKTTGDSDILAMAISKDISDLLSLVEGAKMLPNVERVDIFLRTLDAPFPSSMITPGMAFLLRKESVNGILDDV
ncbi:MAG: Lrp/AsnC family transcriptional regulator [Methanothrix soehngenii]|jgi:DNA-binding Lrp family transcriptional regulator|nr:Lrp/AsnC family transcriptional regulator [Methanothrix soehngenii]